MKFWRILPTLIALLLATVAVFPQAAGTAEITYPEPVALLRGPVEIIGTITLPVTQSYFIQVRELDDTLQPVGGEDALWSPATLPRSAQVVDDVLGEWNTQLIDDGLYEMELVVPQSGDESVRVRVGPVRVANDLIPYDGARFRAYATPTPIPSPTVALTATPIGAENFTPTPRPTRTAADREVTVTAVIQANIRLGDSPSYPAVGFLDVGDTVPAIGQSSRSRWLQIEFDGGRTGFISPSTLRINGDPNFLPRVEPPPLPVTPTPVPPVPTETPVTAANLAVTGFGTDPSSPQCGRTFTIRATITNNGSGATNTSGRIDVADRHLSTNNVTETTIGGFPQLGPGESFTAIIPITVDTYYGETHRLRLTLDSLREIPETNESDNVFTQDYTLQQGDCD